MCVTRDFLLEEKVVMASASTVAATAAAMIAVSIGSSISAARKIHASQFREEALGRRTPREDHHDFEQATEDTPAQETDSGPTGKDRTFESMLNKHLKWPKTHDDFLDETRLDAFISQNDDVKFTNDPEATQPVPRAAIDSLLKAGHVRQIWAFLRYFLKHAGTRAEIFARIQATCGRDSSQMADKREACILWYIVVETSIIATERGWMDFPAVFPRVDDVSMFALVHAAVCVGSRFQKANRDLVECVRYFVHAGGSSPLAKYVMQKDSATSVHEYPSNELVLSVDGAKAGPIAVPANCFASIRDHPPILTPVTAVLARQHVPGFGQAYLAVREPVSGAIRGASFDVRFDLSTIHRPFCVFAARDDSVRATVQIAGRDIGAKSALAQLPSPPDDIERDLDSRGDVCNCWILRLDPGTPVSGKIDQDVKTNKPIPLIGAWRFARPTRQKGVTGGKYRLELASDPCIVEISDNSIEKVVCAKLPDTSERYNDMPVPDSQEAFMDASALERFEKLHPVPDVRMADLGDPATLVNALFAAAAGASKPECRRVWSKIRLLLAHQDHKDALIKGCSKIGDSVIPGTPVPSVRDLALRWFIVFETSIASGDEISLKKLPYHFYDVRLASALYSAMACTGARLLDAQTQLTELVRHRAHTDYMRMSAPSSAAKPGLRDDQKNLMKSFLAARPSVFQPPVYLPHAAVELDVRDTKVPGVPPPPNVPMSSMHALREKLNRPLPAMLPGRLIRVPYDDTHARPSFMERSRQLVYNKGQFMLSWGSPGGEERFADIMFREDPNLDFLNLGDGHLPGALILTNAVTGKMDLPGPNAQKLKDRAMRAHTLHPGPPGTFRRGERENPWDMPDAFMQLFNQDSAGQPSDSSHDVPDIAVSIIAPDGSVRRPKCVIRVFDRLGKLAGSTSTDPDAEHIAQTFVTEYLNMPDHEIVNTFVLEFSLDAAQALSGRANPVPGLEGWALEQDATDDGRVVLSANGDNKLSFQKTALESFVRIT